ncbi:hypothetical protein N7468_003512 [Penicillium chermesinum]|uniref:Enoyl reductase (ER) domain-containing protein n=1 Tax=Penicillium chermesinum TaxID=63820 RepID=A0A9W9P6N7_9EURO|nr:uncharacterized protein N7468_003512 [Penicillium chermesinum]KAJ5238893.1 hypothetical protein N7468_003512 [Penicillium chermesinum]
MSLPTTHQAAAIVEKGKPLSLITRKTPTPGPGEVLLKVQAIAFNPVDMAQRDVGLFIAAYPAISGSDVAGTITLTGPGVSSVQIGDRVTAFASAFFAQGNPDYGATQEYVLVAETVLTPLPASWSFVEGCVLPMATFVAWSAWTITGILRVWGAKRVFDYKAEDVVEQIVSAAKEDGLKMTKGMHAAGSSVQQLGVDVMGALREEGAVSKYGIAPIVDKEVKVPEGVETAFLTGPQPEERDEWLKWVFGTWLKENLAKGRVVASPHIKVLDGGLAAANQALDNLKAGVSATKLAVEL